jgi:hypothetical protein
MIKIGRSAILNVKYLAKTAKNGLGSLVVKFNCPYEENKAKVYMHSKISMLTDSNVVVRSS